MEKLHHRYALSRRNFRNLVSETFLAAYPLLDEN